MALLALRLCGICRTVGDGIICIALTSETPQNLMKAGLNKRNAKAGRSGWSQSCSRHAVNTARCRLSAADTYCAVQRKCHQLHFIWTAAEFGTHPENNKGKHVKKYPSPLNNINKLLQWATLRKTHACGQATRTCSRRNLNAPVFRAAAGGRAIIGSRVWKGLRSPGCSSLKRTYLTYRSPFWLSGQQVN